ncbi:YadA-like family protein [Veillonella agrestimuris]|uniref:YadA-like family protein n=1 Tax=Veillonella agrestimuris TaxID=2941340 RepID=UPI00203C4F4C|nr:YadA-like family protein [Veillonella agrestimuris]
MNGQQLIIDELQVTTGGEKNILIDGDRNNNPSVINHFVGADGKNLNVDNIVIGNHNTIERNNPKSTGSPVFSSVVIGSDNTMSGQHSLVIGEESSATDAATIALGYKANATGSNALAFGQNAKSQSTMTVALGAGSNVEGPMGLGIGADSKVGANTEGGTAIGYNAEVDANVTGGVAIGYNAKSRVNNSTAIGHNAITRSEQGVAIGYNSWANRDAGVVGYDPLTNATYTTTDGSAVTSTWSGSYGAASIGRTYGTTTQTRQLVNVAAGSQDTDAVNVAQLKSLRNYVDTKTNIEEPNTYFHVNDGTNTGTGNATTNYGKVTNAAGATATGAVTGGVNAKGQGLTSVAIGQDSHAVTNESIAIGHNAVAGREDMPGITDPNDRTKVGKNSNIAIGNGAQATGGRNISIGEFAGQDVPDNWNIHNVNIGSEAGTASKKDYSVAIGYQAGALTDATVQAAQAGVVDGNRAPSVLLGKEAGKNTASYGNIAFGTGAASNIIDTRASQTIAIGNGAGSGITSDNGRNNTFSTFDSGANIAIGAAAGQKLSGDGTVAIGNLAGRNSKGDNNILMGHLAGESATSDRSIIMGPQSGIGANVTNDRAVLIGNFANGAVGTETLSTRNVIGIGSSVIATGNESIAVGRLARARATNAVAIGTKANVSGTNSVAVGNDISVTTDNSVVLGASSSGSETATKETTGTITGKGAVITYGDYVGAPPTDVNGNLQTGYYVSVGKSGAERQIKHVAAGKVSQDSTDAINGSQLYATNQVVGNVAGSVTNILGGNATLGKDGNITMTNIGDTGENTIHDAIKKVSKEPNIYFHVNDGTNTGTGNAATNYGKISDAAGATHANSIAAGVNAQAHSAGSIAVGANTVATNALSNDANRGSVVIGNNAVVAGGMVNGEQYGNSSVAIGANALAGRVIENGVVSETSAKYTTNTGGLTATNANKNGNVMYLSGLSGDLQKTNDATAVGKDSRAVGDQAVAIGAQVVAGHASVAIGGNDLETIASDIANVTAYKTITGVDLATNIQADGVYPTTSAMKGSVAIGQKATSRTLMGTALGTTASVFEGGTLGTAIGTGARVGATDGSGSAQGGLAAGAGAVVEGDYSTALGNRSSATGTESASVGYKNTVAGNSSVALGSNINVTTDNSVVLGANSDGSANATTETEGKITTTNGNEVVFGTYVGAPVDGGHYVSVGAKDAERQIKHVAAGKVSADSTDAINGSQLYATNKVVAELVDNSMSSFNVKSTATDGNVATGSATDAQAIKNGKTVEMQAGKNLTIKQTNTTDGNAQVEYSLADNIQVGQKGEPGKDGVDGKIGVNGQDGSAVVINGKDGSIGLNGKDGTNGLTIKGGQGPAGVDGKDGEIKTRIVYERPDPNDTTKTITEEVATLNDGLKFGGDMGNVQAVKLNKQVDVKGGITDATKLATGDNIGVTAVAGTNGNAVLNVQLAKDITGLNSVTTNEVRLGDTNNYTTVKKDGDRITYTTPDGNGGTTVNKIANLSDEIHITDTTYTVGDKTKRANAKDDEITLTYTDGNGKEVANKFAIIQGVAKSDLSNITDEGKKNITKLGTIVKAGDNVTVTSSSDKTTGQTTYTVNAITPAIYTDKNGNKVYPITDATGNTTWNTQPNGSGTTIDAGDVITSFTTPTGDTKGGTMIVKNVGSAINTPGSTGDFLTKLDTANTATPNAVVNVSDLKNTSDALRANELHIAPTVTNRTGETVGGTASGNTATGAAAQAYKYDPTTKQVVMTYNDGTGKTVSDTKAVIDLSNLPTGGSMDSFNVKSSATDGTVAAGSQGAQAITDGKTVEMQAGKNLTIKQTNENGNAKVEYSLADDIVIGKDGKDGVDGKIGVNGKDGASVVVNGKDGSIGLTGPKGADGKDGASATIKAEKGKDGLDGTNGVNGITRIVYERQQPDPTDPSKTITVKEEVATLNDGLKFTGNNDKVNKNKLNTIVTVQGERTDTKKEYAASESAANNIIVEANGKDGDESTLTVKLNKDLQNISSINNGNSSITINENPGTNNGITTPAVKIDGGSLDMSNNQIINQGSGATGKDANNNPIYNNDTNGANIGDVKNIVNESGWMIKSSADTVNGGVHAGDKSQDIKNGKSVDFQAGKNITVTQTNDGNGNATINVAVNKNLTGLDSVGINGKDGKDGLTIKGGDGKNGVDGTSITRIVYERPDPNDTTKTITEEVATLNDGLKFGGDMGNVQAVKLNKQVDVKGGITDATKLATGDNIGVTAVAGTNGNAVLNVQLAKDITGLNSVTTNEVRLGDTNNYTTVKKDGDRITYTTPDGNGGTMVNKIANLSDEIHITDTTYTVGDKTKRANAKDDEITLTYTDGNGQEVANKFAIIQGVAKSDLSNITNEGAKNITKLGTIVKAGDNVTVDESKDQTTGQTTYTVNAKAQDLGKALLTYKANGSNSQTVTLNKGLNFTDGNYTIASVGADGVVKYDVILGDTPTIKDGKAGVPGKDGNPGKDGIATIGEVVNIVNNTGWKANAKGNITGTTPIATVVKPGDTVNYAAGSNLVVSQTLGTNEQTYTFRLSDNITAGRNGKDGKDGSIGATGKDGNSVVLNGKDGSIGLTGKDGRDGVNGRDGASIDITTAKGEQVLVNRDPNHAGDTDQAERIVYMPKDKDGNYIKGEDGKNIVREVATMDDGLIFTGNNKTLNKHELNSTVKIIGERTDNKTSYTAAESAANNLIVEADGGSTLTVKMAKDLINLNSVTAGTAKLGNQTTTTVGGNAGGTGSYVTGLDNKTWNIDNPDIVSGRAATEDQLKVVSDKIKTTETDIINKGFGLKADDGNSAKEILGNTISVVGKETTGSDGTGHKNITTSVENNEVKIALNKELDLGKDGSVTTGDTTINNDGVTINDGKGNVTTVNKGGLTITNKDGNRVTVDGSGLTIENGPSVTKDGIDAGNKQITNQASGASGKDANGNSIYNVDTNGANIGDVKQIAKNTAEDVVNKSGWTANATGNVVGSATATKVTPNTTVNFDAGDNLEITQTVNGNTQTYSYRLKDDLVLGGKDGVDGKAGKDGSIGINGKDGSAVVINGKDGSIGLNGKDGANGLTIKGDQGPAGVNGKDGETITRIEYERTNPDGSKTTEQVATLNDGLKFTGNNTDTVNKHQLNTLVKVQGEGVSPAQSANFQSAAGNINVVANGSDTLEVRLNKDLTNISSISNTTNGPKISFGDNSVNITNGDLNMGGNKITNVAPGKDKTDVATVGQMTQVTSKDESVLVSESTNADGAKVYDLSVQSVDGRVARELSAEIGRVGAQGAALAALKPIQYDPLEPTQIMAGYGNYRGNSALALGVAHYKNESTMIHGGVSWAAGDGNHMMANAGITWKVGSRDSEAAIADRYRKGPISSAYALQNEMAAMKAENTGLKGEVAGLKAQNDQIIAENAEMKAENQEMKAQIAMLMQRLGL